MNPRESRDQERTPVQDTRSARGDAPVQDARGAREDGRAPDAQASQEQGGTVTLLTAHEARAVLRNARRIAVVGASPDPTRPSHEVMRHLLAAGYDCVPVNPSVSEVMGRATFPDLASATAAGGRFDIVDVFRRPEAAPAIAREAVDVGASVLWLQLGVVSWEAARIAAEGGLAVVMDRCTKIEHRALMAEGG